MKRWRLTPPFVSLLAFVLLAASLPVAPAAATTPPRPLASCGVTVTPHHADTSATVGFNVTVTNTDAVAIDWVRLLAPSSQFTIIDAAAPSGWFVSSNSEEVLITNSSIAPGASLTYTVTTNLSIVRSPTQYWEVMAASDEGDNPIDCTGDTSAAIGSLGPPEIANVAAFNVTPTSATVFWTTERPTSSRVELGTTTRYGVTKTASALTTSHSIALSGLSPATTYHFRVTSADDTASATSGDNTFATAPLPVPTPAATSDTTAPTIRLTSTFDRPQATVPAITGQATDNIGISRIDYSTNGGHDWLPATITSQSTTRTGATANFSFTPTLPDDGNYTIITRATDTSSNTAFSPSRILIVDRLPPRFGVTRITIGPQALVPSGQNEITAPAGTELNLATSLIGGPTSVTLTASPAAGQATSPLASFTLSQDAETGLWTGRIAIPRAGLYQLIGAAVDGADNHTTRTLAQLRVTTPLYVVNEKNTAVHNATATLYFRNPQNQQWDIWDGSPYGQDNPSAVNAHGALSLLVPPGTYYLQVSSSDATVATRSFQLDAPTPLTGLIRLQPAAIHIGPLTIKLPWNNVISSPIRKSPASSAIPTTRLPLASLTTTTGQTLTPTTWYGKPTVIINLVTWTPDSALQLASLGELADNADINVIPLISQEPTETIAAYQQITGYTRPILTDPLGLLSDSLTTPAAPALYFFDRHGNLTAIKTGLTSNAAIMKQLSQL